MRRPSPSLIVSLIALFVALGGSSYAAVTLKANSVTSREIKNHSIKQRDLARGVGQVSRARIAQVVESTMTSDEVLSALSAAVEGDAGPKGDKGDPGQSVAGPQGAAGRDGQDGARGEALGYIHVSANGIGKDPTGNLHVERAGDKIGHYCVDSAVGSNLVVTIDRTGETTFTGAVAYVETPSSNPDVSPCAGQKWEVTIGVPFDSGAFSSEDHAFYAVLN